MLLPWLILIPFIGGLLSWQADRFSHRAPRWVALASMGITLILSIQLWLQGDYSLANPQGIPQWQAVFFMPWIPSLGINFHLAIDGLSLLMVVLTAIMGAFSVLSSWSENQANQGAYHFNLLWIIAGVMGIFTAVDLFLFFFFWEMMLIPMYFLIANWGHKGAENRQHINAATKFFIYTQASGLIMLVSIVGLALVHFGDTSVWTFNYNELLGTQMSSTVGFMLMLGFFIAFAVKMPLVPFHGWMADTQEQSPTAGSVDISGIMLKTAAYGLLRFTLPLFPEASIEFTPIAMTLGVISIFYGAWLAFKQTDIKRLAAYSSLSHMGFVTVAIYASSVLAYQGAVIQMITNGLSGAALIIISGQLYERTQTRDMRMMGGLWKRIKWLPGLSLFFAAATLGMPGTGNFIGEFMILFGTFSQFTLVTCIMVFGVVFASVYSLWMMQQTYYGTPKSESEMKGLTAREFGVLLALAVLLVIIGFFPQPLLDTSAGAMETLHNLYTASLTTLRP
ncbi:NADH-quinone oxidoreductase subunit M [Providencia stuartii]|uniref:NADH-quinone oxidoreductase subunit M n=2 Tax=Providencia TaxID=586 RepID=A0A1S1HMF3_PROST|nr:MULTISPECIES: NADH-quinone oxidoreductase subunit M [Providencia]MDV5224860.1 NADH-quinone oxidoreductase subunit M [Providencia rettgeri]ELR5039655.1 NADH-quinone oxidoreductase subunit M [Providencia stuartii]ELR5080876.1 NADH-quinone oxidoreductase subunit M [Providencia stuartii]ELR5113118.1 NADH-quinone oxidoreductase subunit M [Providencia stuartii]ELR5300681.1 NADH-quinone oxidoreductase subunit M [Providencia stuartii]